MGISKAAPEYSVLLGIHIEPSIVTFMAKIYCRESIQSKVSKEKRHIGEVRSQETRCNLPLESHWQYLIPPGLDCDSAYEMMSTKEAY